MDIQRFMQACKDGARKMDAVLCSLYDDYREALLHDGYVALGDQDLARDLLQDTLLKAWQNCATFRGESQLFPWLRRIYRNSLVDLLRRRRIEVPLAADGAEIDPEIEQAWRGWRGDVDGGPEGQLRSKQAEQCFRHCAQRFANDHPLASTVVRWVAQDGLSLAEVAQLLGRSPGATREFVSQCRKKARVYFADWHALALDQRSGDPATEPLQAP